MFSYQRQNIFFDTSYFQYASVHLSVNLTLSLFFPFLYPPLSFCTALSLLPSPPPPSPGHKSLVAARVGKHTPPPSPPPHGTPQQRLHGHSRQGIEPPSHCVLFLLLLSSFGAFFYYYCRSLCSISVHGLERGGRGKKTRDVELSLLDYSNEEESLGGRRAMAVKT